MVGVLKTSVQNISADIKSTSAEIKNTGKSMVSKVDTRMDSLVTILDKRSGQTLDLFDKKSDKSLRFLDNTFIRSEKVLKSESGAYRAMLNQQLTVANRNAGILTQRYSEIPNNIANKLNPYIDCDKNSLCWQNNVSDTLMAIRFASQSVGESSIVLNEQFPHFVKDFGIMSKSLSINVPIITEQAAQTSRNIQDFTHPKWYWKVLGGVGQASGIYFNTFGVSNIRNR